MAVRGLTSQESRRNFVLGVGDGALWRIWFVLTDPTIVLTWFLSQLTSSPIIAGLATPIRDIGALVPQLLVSDVTQRMPRKMRMYRITAAMRAVSWILATVAVFVLGSGNPTVLLVAFLTLYSIKMVAMGMSIPAWMDIVAGGIPGDRRGAWASARDVIGGVLGIGASVAARFILDERSGLRFPYNFGVLFAVAGVPLLAAYLVFSNMVEVPAQPTQRAGSSHPGVVKPMDVLRDRNYVWYILARLALQATLAAVPFYTLYAKTRLGAPTAMVGVYTAVMTVATMASSVLWGRLCDRHGNRLVMLWVAILTVLMTAWPLALGPRVSYAAFTVQFFLVGVVQAGTMLVRMTFVMDLAPPTARVVYAGVVNTAAGLVSILSMGAGWVVQKWGAESLFALCLAVSVVAPFLVVRIWDPRVRRAKCDGANGATS